MPEPDDANRNQSSRSKPGQPKPQPLSAGYKVLILICTALFLGASALLLLSLPGLPSNLNADLIAGTSDRVISRAQLLLLPCIFALVGAFIARDLIRPDYGEVGMPVATDWGWAQKYRSRRFIDGVLLTLSQVVYLDLVLSLALSSPFFPVLGFHPAGLWIFLGLVVLLALGFIFGSHLLIISREKGRE